LYIAPCCQLEESSPADYNFMLTQIQTFLAEDETDKILNLAIEMGFNPQWLATKKGAKKVTPGPAF